MVRGLLVFVLAVMMATVPDTDARSVIVLDSLQLHAVFSVDRGKAFPLLEKGLLQVCGGREGWQSGLGRKSEFD